MTYQWGSLQEADEAAAFAGNIAAIQRGTASLETVSQAAEAGREISRQLSTMRTSPSPAPAPAPAPAPGLTIAGLPGAALVGALGAVPVVGGALAAVAGTGLAIYGGLQAMGLGEGEGLFGLDILGGDVQYVNGIPIGGPGLAEPSKDILIKEWHVNYDKFRLQYYLVQKPGTRSRYIMLYNTRTKQWKSWRWKAPSLAVIGKNMPRHQMLTRLRRNLKRHSADARTILKLTSPGSLKAPRRHRR